jgi:chlorophyllide a oxygenase
MGVPDPPRPAITAPQVAGRVLGEDMPLIQGQQEQLLRGGDTWSFPVSYDKLAVRYRRWRNAVAAGERNRDGSEARSLPVAMNAGELFSIEEAGEGESGGRRARDEWNE